MTDDLQKNVTITEADPKKLAEHQQDEPGSFLDLYRSADLSTTQMDEALVEKCVIEGVVPYALRYGVMQRGDMHVFRGVVKSNTDLHYFNWSEGTEFRLVKADDATKQWDAEKMFKSCTMGCDLLKGDETPLDNDETVEEATEDDTKAGPQSQPNTATMPTSPEEEAIAQERMLQEHHPGSTTSQTPDDPTRGRNWHEPVRRAQDAMDMAQAAVDGEQHWSAPDLLKAWGQKLQATAPRVTPRISKLESQFMQEVLGADPDAIAKGFAIPPRFRVDFARWKATQLRGRVSGLESWLAKRNGETA